MPVSAKTRRTKALVGITSRSSPPSASARVCACTKAPTPADAQNCVPVMSTTNVLCPRAAASSRTARSQSALLTSISAGAATTGTPLTISMGYLTTGICAHLPGLMRTTVPRTRGGLDGVVGPRRASPELGTGCFVNQSSDRTPR